MKPILARHIKLHKISDWMPEQYTALYRGINVGFLHLRSHLFTVTFPDSNGSVIFSARTDGDGSFEDRERERFLEEAKNIIASQLMQLR